jgi:hypothetical protein
MSRRASREKSLAGGGADKADDGSFMRMRAERCFRSENLTDLIPFRESLSLNYQKPKTIAPEVFPFREGWHGCSDREKALRDLFS